MVPAKIADTIKRGIERGMEDAASKSRDNEKSRRYNFNEAGDIFEENAAESEGDKSTGHSWDDPDWTLIDDRRGDLPDLPLDVFTALGKFAAARLPCAGVRPEGVAVPLIGVASSLIGTARRVRPSLAWSEPITCWTCVVAKLWRPQDTGSQGDNPRS